jgi:pimeloyl-ACP methyl ester carboxylesterase
MLKCHTLVKLLILFIGGVESANQQASFLTHEIERRVLKNIPDFVRDDRNVTFYKEYPATHYTMPTLNGFDIHADYYDRGKEYTIMFSYGSGGGVQKFTSFFSNHAKIEANFFFYDYAGYGTKKTVSPTGSSPYTQENFLQSAETAFNIMATQAGIPPEKTVLFGYCVGSVAALHIAEKTAAEGRPVAGLILVAPMLSFLTRSQKFHFLVHLVFSTMLIKPEKLKVLFSSFMVQEIRWFLYFMVSDFSRN